MTDKHQDVLIARYLSGEATPEEIKQIQDLLQKDDSFRQSLQAMTEVWQVQENISIPVDAHEAWQNLKAHINLQEQKQKRPNRAFRPSFRLPLFPGKRLVQWAMGLLLICASYFTYQHIQSNTGTLMEPYQTVTVDYGRRLDLTLADGSHVVLDAGSELRYPTEPGACRDVYLKGEAFFEVTHDAHRPFRVFAQHAAVRVLGTKFNVRAWSENPTVAVTVSEGTVTLCSKDMVNAQTVVIPKGYSSSLADKGLPTTPTPTEAESSLNWMHNEIKFKDASVREVLAQLERWYDLKFNVVDPSILEQRITVHIRMTRIEDILELVSILTDTRTSKNDNVVTIRSKK